MVSIPRGSQIILKALTPEQRNALVKLQACAAKGRREGGQFLATEAKVLDFVKDVLGNPSVGNNRWIDYRVVGHREAQLLQSHLGESFEGWTRTIDESAVKHIWARHSAGNEKNANQIPVTAADIAKIPEITRNPDKVYLDIDRNGRELICYEKQYAGKVYLFEERRYGRRKLVPISMRIVKTK